ncbi:MAG: hypothetical protein Q7S12_01970 [bacterium]|nr:hypothetical protein [bacterium]
MFKHRVNAILGFFIILMPYLAFPLLWNNLFYVVSGVVIVVFSFWSLSEAKHKDAEK